MQFNDLCILVTISFSYYKSYARSNSSKYHEYNYFWIQINYFRFSYINFYGTICSIQILIDDIFGIMHLIVILREIVSLLWLWMNTAFIFFLFFSVTIGWYAISREYVLVVVARVAVGEHWLLGCLLFWHNQIVEWEKL